MEKYFGNEFDCFAIISLVHVLHQLHRLKSCATAFFNGTTVNCRTSSATKIRIIRGPKKGVSHFNSY
jgi:hypothetical protein